MGKMNIDPSTNDEIKEVARGLISGKYRLPQDIGSDAFVLGSLLKDNKPEDYEGVTFLFDCSKSVRSCNGIPCSFQGKFILGSDYDKAVKIAKTMY